MAPHLEACRANKEAMLCVKGGPKMQRQIGPISHRGPSEPCHLWLPSVLWSSDGVFLGDLWVGVVLVYYNFLNVLGVEWCVVTLVF